MWGGWFLDRCVVGCGGGGGGLAALRYWNVCQSGCYFVGDFLCVYVGGVCLKSKETICG